MPIEVECVEITNSGEDAQHPGRDNRRSLNEADVIHVRLNEQYDRNRHTAERRREYDNGSDIFLLDVPRQQKLVVMIGTGTKEWSSQGDKKQAHNRHSPGIVFNCPGGDCGRGRLRLPAPGVRPTASEPKKFFAASAILHSSGSLKLGPCSLAKRCGAGIQRRRSQPG
jgi:hypothetical protein